MGTTTRNQIPYPEGSNQPAGHTQMKSMADYIDLRIPYVAAAAPSHVKNLLWHNTTDGTTFISDGATWHEVGGEKWAPYTPAWTGIANMGTPAAQASKGRFIRKGRRVTVQVRHTAGPSASLGTNNIFVSLPVQAAFPDSGSPVAEQGDLWTGVGLDRPDFRPMWVLIAEGATTANIVGMNASRLLVPLGMAGHTYASGTKWNLSFTYEGIWP